ncbi:hypothetical protein [Paraburkholderia azotifigens]|uniref:Uncharacterized protein n=1 Tax=Paraburkholderia azotifigens TaxID=2057004 RepID=A0ABU9R3H5_9BURK
MGSFEEGGLVGLIEDAGLRQELEDRVEARKLEKRKALLAERARLLKERDEELPALEAKAIAAYEALASLEQKVIDARQVLAYTHQRVHGANCRYGTGLIDAEIERLAPKFMQDAFDALQEPIDFLQGTVRFRPEQRRAGWGFHSIDVSNTEEIAALRKKCRDGQEEIRQMMFDVDGPAAAQRVRCAAIVEECVAMARPHLKDDRHWLTHQERKARATKLA